MVSHFWHLRLSEVIKLGWKKVRLVFTPSSHTPRSVRDVFRKYEISFMEIRNNINEKKALSFISRFKPDVIISSQSLYFGGELLSVPKLCCINRHSGLLPRNGGLWPGFQAVRKGEAETGVSVHTMEKKIDAGIVLSQINISI